MIMKIGVLALQGAFIEHVNVLRQLRVEASPVRLPHELDNLDGVIIPGGESTSILSLMQSFELVQPLRERANAGLPILGTCAGMICLAKKVSDSINSKLESLALMEIEVKRKTPLADRWIALRPSYCCQLWVKSLFLLFSFALLLLRGQLLR